MKTKLLQFILCLIGHFTYAQLPVYEWAGLMPATVSFPNSVFEIEADSDGNVYSTGCFAFSIDMDPGPNEHLLDGVLDIYIQKIGPDGQFKWAHKIGGEGREGIMAAALAFPEGDGGLSATPDGSVYVANMTTSDSLDLDPGPGVNMYYKAPNQNYTKWDTFIVKLDSNGVFQWGHGFGGSQNERIVKLRLDANGNILALGAFSGTVDFDPGQGEAILTSTTESVFILSLSANGEFNWVRQLVSTESIFGTDMDIDGNGFMHIVGTFQGVADMNPNTDQSLLSSLSGQSTFVLVLDESGDYFHSWSIGSTSGSSDQADYGLLFPVISANSSGETLITIRLQGVVEIDPFGNGQGLTIFGPDNSYDPFLLKVNSDGSVNWIGQLAQQIRLVGVLDDSGNSYLFGSGEQGAQDIDPGNGIAPVEFEGSYEGFVASISSNGNFQWVRLLGDPAFNETSHVSSFSIHGDSSVYFSGFLGGGMDADPNESQNAILTNAANAGSIYLVKWSLDTVMWVNSTELKSSIRIWPNPSSGKWAVDQSPGDQNVTTRLLTMQGELVFERKHRGQTIREECDAASGVYRYQVISGTDSFSTLVVVE